MTLLFEPRRSGFTLSLALLATSPLAAQHGPSVLTLLDADDRAVQVGEPAVGTLGVGDWVAPDGAYLQAWAIDLQRGTRVTVDLASNDFDPYLYVLGPGLGDPISDDDGGGACNARITFRAPEDGDYRIVVSGHGFEGGDGGEFSLSVSSAATPIRPGTCGETVDAAFYLDLPTDDRMLTLDEGITGELTGADAVSPEGRHVEAWAFTGEAGQDVTFDLISRDFDAFLYLAGPGLGGALTNDDGAGACNARITLMLPESGTYRVIASTLPSDEVGRYEIRAAGHPGPMLEGNCPGGGGGGAADVDELLLLDAGDREIHSGEVIPAVLEVGDPVVGGGRHAQAWAFTAEAGESYQIDLSSPDFDPFVYLLGPGLETYLSDDDGGSGSNARLRFTALESGVHMIVVSSFGAMQTGSFILRVGPG